MKAVILDKYDKNGRELQVRELPVPEPGPAKCWCACTRQE